MKTVIFSLFLVMALVATAQASPLDGNWVEVASGRSIEIVAFNNEATFQTTSFYPNGAVVNWTFDFTLPADGVVVPNQLIPGIVRSQDGYFGCTFVQPAQAMLNEKGLFKLRYPVLTYRVVAGRCLVIGQNWVSNLFQKF